MKKDEAEKNQTELLGKIDTLEKVYDYITESLLNTTTLWYLLQAFELVSDEAKKDIKKQIEEVQAELKNSLSEVNRNVNEVRAEISNVLNEIRKEHKNIKAEVDQIKEYVQKIFQLVVDMRYKVMF